MSLPEVGFLDPDSCPVLSRDEQETRGEEGERVARTGSAFRMKMQKIAFQLKKNFMEKIDLRKGFRHALDKGFDKSTNEVKKNCNIFAAWLKTLIL